MAGDEDLGRVSPARKTDPATSHRGATDVRLRAGSQKAKLLQAYRRGPEGLTPNEARAIAGLHPESCYWKRCGELRDAGLVLDTGKVRPGAFGPERWVGVITDAGINKLYDLKASGA